MREIIALLFLICTWTISIYLVVGKQISAWTLTALLGMSLVAAFVIATYPSIQRFKWSDFEFEAFERDVAAVRDTAIAEIKEEIARQKESVHLVITAANDLRERIRKQTEELQQLVARSERTEIEIDRQEHEIRAIAAEVNASVDRISELNRASDMTALLFIKVTWLQAETRGEFGGTRAKRAYQEITEDLNKILQTVIPDQSERDRWINELNNSLPARPSSNRQDSR